LDNLVVFIVKPPSLGMLKNNWL